MIDNTLHNRFVFLSSRLIEKNNQLAYALKHGVPLEEVASIRKDIVEIHSQLKELKEGRSVFDSSEQAIFPTDTR